jgi:hypothetical protein
VVFSVSFFPFFTIKQTFQKFRMNHDLSPALQQLLPRREDRPSRSASEPDVTR